MMGKINLVTGTYLVKVIKSPINGNISVVKSLAFGTYLSVGNLTQSGGVVYEIWNKTIKKLKKEKLKVKSCLILGLGGGSVARIVRNYWQDCSIIGVDIDPLMVSLGKKYLNLDKYKTDVVIDDAKNFLKKSKKKFDLICIDLYVGDNFPKKFETDDFIKMTKDHLSKNGVVVFNRLYYDEKRSLAMKFMKKLEKYFKSVFPFFPEANVMFICTN